MLAQEFIRQKRDGKELAAGDIGDFIAGLTISPTDHSLFTDY